MDPRVKLITEYLAQSRPDFDPMQKPWFETVYLLSQVFMTEFHDFDSVEFIRLCHDCGREEGPKLVHKYPPDELQF